MSRSLQKILLLALTATVVLGIIAIESVWLLMDTRLQPVVDPWVEKSLNLADGLWNSGFSDFWRHIYWASLGPRPPLYPLLATTPLWLVDRSVDSILLVNRASLILLAYATYRLASRIMDHRVGFLATALVLLYPLTTMLVKVARPHALLPAVVAFALLALYAVAFDTPKSRKVWIAAFSVLLVFSAHAAGLYTLLVACLLAGVWLTKNVLQEHSGSQFGHQSIVPAWLGIFRSGVFIRGVLPAATIVTALIGGWMYLKMDQYRGLQKVSREIFGSMFGEWHYEATAAQALGTIGLGLFLIAICALLLCRSSLHEQTKRGTVFLFVSLFGAVLISHLRVGGKSWDSMAGVLPIIAVLSALGLVSLVDHVRLRWRFSPIRNYLMPLVAGLALAGSVFTYGAVNWGKDWVPQRLARAAGVSLSCDEYPSLHGPVCSNPPLEGDWFIHELLTLIVADDYCKKMICEVAVLGHRQSYFSHEALSYALVLEYSQESRVESDSFYPDRRVKFLRVNGDIEDAERQITSSEFVVVLENHGSDDPRQRNQFVENERLLNENLLLSTMGSSTKLSILLKKRLPTRETLVLLKRWPRSPPIEDKTSESPVI